MVAFGGGGPMHGPTLAKAEYTQVIVPWRPPCSPPGA
ncbi:MAG: hypothetical protein ACLUEK_12220 [Oscillospiraceae bacterium]